MYVRPVAWVRRWFASASISKRFVLMMLAVVMTAAATGYSSIVYWQLGTQRASLTDFSNSITRLLAQDFARIVLLNDLVVAADASARLEAFPALKYLVLYDTQGVPRYQFIADVDNPLAPPEIIAIEHAGVRLDRGIFISFESVRYAGREIGSVYVEMEAQSLLSILRRDALALTLIAVFVLLLSYGLASYFARSFNRPILKLVGFLDGVGYDAELDQRIETDECNEFGRLYKGVNQMLDRLESSNEQLLIAAAAFEAPDGMLITDADAVILSVNEGFTRISGFAAHEVVGQRPNILSSGRHEPLFYESMWRTLRSSGRWEGEIWNRNRSGEHFPCRLTIQIVKSEDGSARYYVGSMSDISLQKTAEAKVEYLDYFDPLTGHANRYHLLQKLQEVIARAASESLAVGALICVDLDDFKKINDSFGHASGDKLLIEMGRRVRAVVGAERFIARLGADEFAVLIQGLAANREEAACLAESLAQRLIDGLQKPYEIGSQMIRCSPSAGIELIEGSASSAEVLIEHADVALHHAKSDPDKRWCFFDVEVQHKVRRHLEIQHQLEQALLGRELELHYQNQVASDGRLVGVEALVRWLKAKGGAIPPSVFIPVAEHSGLIDSLGAWVLAEACSQIMAWNEQGAKDLQVAVNVSARQFGRSDFVNTVRNVLDQTGAPPCQLKLELTESAMLLDANDAIRKMQALRQIGVSLALDDFGTGYSSLRYLRQLPIDQVKIDQSFVRDMLDDPASVAIVRSILSLGAAMGFEVIAEGVETAEQHGALAELGCRYFQGYYFGRPCPASEIACPV